MKYFFERISNRRMSRLTVGGVHRPRSAAPAKNTFDSLQKYFLTKCLDIKRNNYICFALSPKANTSFQ